MDMKINNQNFMMRVMEHILIMIWSSKTQAMVCNYEDDEK
jgi:hypothetical protein